MSEKRDHPEPGPALCKPEVERGKGDAYQWYLKKQVSDNQECDGQNSCGVSHLKSYTISYSVNSGINLEFFCGGISVSASYTTGNSCTCKGKAGDKICVWAKIAHTEYPVDLKPPKGCDTKEENVKVRARIRATREENIIVLPTRLAEATASSTRSRMRRESLKKLGLSLPL